MTDPAASDASRLSDSAQREVAAGMAAAQVVLKPRKARPFFGRHPWVLDSAIQRVEGSPTDGDVVDLLSDKGKFIARGAFNSQSRIRVRLFTWDASEAIDGAFWRRRIHLAIAWRRELGYDRRDGAARLVFSEADGLSGLIVDRYGDYLVVQATALAVAMRLDQILPPLIETVHPHGILGRQERGLARVEGVPPAEPLLWGDLPDGPVFVVEHGLRYGVDPQAGQKTGFYLDQRENRRAAAGYCRGRRVLDMFCYSGGFALAAAALGPASEVLGVDSSKAAVALARANAELNGIAHARFQVGEAFETLDELAAQRERFGAVILDPPKFARSRASVHDALMAYHRLNRGAMALLEPGGILVTCSCSGHVTREDFLYMLAGLAQRMGRDVQILEQRGAAPDHPVSASCLESEYLKCFICRVA